jgi:hypothetical protein
MQCFTAILCNKKPSKKGFTAILCKKIQFYAMMGAGLMAV